MDKLVEGLNIGIAYIRTYIATNMWFSDWSWVWLKAKAFLNLISLILAFGALAVFLWWLYDNYIVQPRKWQDMSWDRKDFIKIAWWFISILLFWSTLLGTLVWWFFVYILK